MSVFVLRMPSTTFKVRFPAISIVAVPDSPAVTPFLTSAKVPPTYFRIRVPTKTETQPGRSPGWLSFAAAHTTVSESTSYLMYVAAEVVPRERAVQVVRAR
ncbi:MAG: hypothetical protein KatS3mg012_1951 [Gaiellaceae bacterium]|nr:MAG: hypothetical protein KatS3mg012_1951 [Gaiellaceae bacterium]